MELTYEEANRMVTDRLNDHPEIWNLYSNPSFKKDLLELLIFLDIDIKLLPIIENEVLIVLTFYTPLDTLAGKMAENTGLSREKSEELVLMLNATLLKSVKDELTAFEYLWNNELRDEGKVPEANKEFREKLELRPQTQPVEQIRPLTREAVAQAIAPSRTMAGDIQSVSKTHDAKWSSEK